tara:strand:+ start:447 stop:965 length:519 start_codon:yes stop_codon:yes gene_type:complete
MAPKRTGNGTFVFTDIESVQGVSGDGTTIDMGTIPNTLTVHCSSIDTFDAKAFYQSTGSAGATGAVYTPPTYIENCCLPIDIGGGADFLYEGYIDIANVRLVVGNYQQPLYVNSYEHELEKCQRYFETNTTSDDDYMHVLSMPGVRNTVSNVFKFTYVIDDDIYETNNSGCN